MRNDDHITPLSWTDALDLVESVNTELARAMALLMKPTGKPVYRASYRYGDAIIDRGGKLRPPCDALACKPCMDLKKICGEELPLALVIDECCEVHLKTTRSNTVPLRLLREGESFGLFELLDRLYPDPTGKSQPPHWLVVAGAKSVYITSPYCTEPLGKALRCLLPPDIVDARFPQYTVGHKKVSRELKDNPYLFIRFLEKAALQRNDALKPWMATVLIFPSSAMLPLLCKSGGAFLEAAKDFLLQVHGTSWIQSRNLRVREVEASEIERQLADRGSKVKYLLARTIQQVLAIARGDQPAFAPYSDQLRAGPFSAVQDFFLSSKLNEKLAQPTFPAILQPCHLGDQAGQSRFGYLSLSIPYLIGEEYGSFSRDLADDLVGNLRKSKFTKNVRISLHTSLGDDRAFQSDFAHQFNIAREKWHVKDSDFFGDFKQGFTLRFIRIESSGSAAAEPKVFRAAG